MTKTITKYYSIFIIGVFAFYNCSSNKNGSIKEKTEQQKQIDNLLDSAIKIQNTEPDNALAIFLDGLKTSNTLNYDKGINGFYKQVTYNLCVYQNEFDKAHDYALEHLNFSKKLNNEKYIASAYSNIALTFAIRDISDSASFYYLNAIEFAKKANDSGTLISCHVNIVSSYLRQNNYQKGLEYSLLALEAARIKKDTPLIANINNNVSIIYRKLSDTTKAISATLEAYHLYPLLKSSSLKISIISSMSTYLLDSKQYDSAILFYNKLENLSNEISDTVHLTDAAIGKAYTYFKMNNLIAAKKEIDKALPLKERATLPLNKALNYYQVRYEIYKKIGYHTEALVANENYVTLSDSLYKNNEGKIAIQKENEIKQKEYEKNIAEKQLKITKKNSTIALLLTGIGALSIIGFLFYRNQRKRKQLHEKNISFLKKENEWQSANAALEAQLQERNRISREIHDELGASLTSISLSTELLRTKLKDQSEEIDKISNTSSTMVDSLNEIIWSLNSGNDSLKSLVAYTRKMFFSFLDDTTIVPQFFATPINEDIILPGSIRRTLYLTTKESLNNAIKHAQAKHIKLNIIVEDEKLVLQIKDDGKGIISTNEFGNGLRNMKENIEKIGGHFLIQSEYGVTITIEYPLKK
jgi:signal transduction histidine kinase